MKLTSSNRSRLAIATHSLESAGCETANKFGRVGYALQIAGACKSLWPNSEGTYEPLLADFLARFFFSCFFFRLSFGGVSNQEWGLTRNACFIARNHYSQIASHEGAISMRKPNLSWAIMGHRGYFWLLTIMCGFLKQSPCYSVVLFSKHVTRSQLR